MKRPWKRTNDSRTLLLEQLENRSLLSADLFADFTRSDEDGGRDRRHDHQRDQQRRDRDRPGEVRSLDHCVDCFRDRDGRGSQTQDMRPGLAARFSSFAFNAYTPAVSAPTSQVATPTPIESALPSLRSTTTPEGESATRVAEPVNETLPTNTPPASASTSAPPVLTLLVVIRNASPPTSPPASPPVAGEAVNDAPAPPRQATSSDFLGESGGASDLQQETGTASLPATSGGLSSFEFAPGATDWFGNATRYDVTVSESSGEPQDLDDGWIDDLPIDLSQDHAAGAQVNEWRITPDTIDRLAAGEEVAVGPLEAIDDAIATWVGGPGGLIELGREASDIVFPIGPAAFVDIALDTSVGIHRSLDLIAAEESSSEAKVRDAVLAALAGDLAAAAQPVVSAARTSLPTAAIPGTALLATGWAMARHRRRPQEDGELKRTR